MARHQYRYNESIMVYTTKPNKGHKSTPSCVMLGAWHDSVCVGSTISWRWFIHGFFGTRTLHCCHLQSRPDFNSTHICLAIVIVIFIVMVCWYDRVEWCTRHYAATQRCDLHSACSQVSTHRHTFHVQPSCYCSFHVCYHTNRCINYLLLHLLHLLHHLHPVIFRTLHLHQ